MSRYVTEIPPACVYVNIVNPDQASEKYLLIAYNAYGCVISF